MKKVVLFDTTLATSNQGDDIIYQSLLEQLAPLLNNASTMRYATHIGNFTLPQYVRMRGKRSFAELCDYKIVMGTNLLSRDLFATRYQWMITLRNHFLYRHSIMAGVGTTHSGTKITWYSRLIYGLILNKNLYHSVRDEESAAMLQALGVKALNTGCPTLWKLTPEFCSQIPVNKARDVVFSLSGYGDQLDAKQDQKLLDILQRNYETLYFWNQTTDDEPYLRTLHCDKEIKVINSLREYDILLTSGNLDYIGTRLHGGVYALQHAVRTIVVSIDHRAEGFHESNNLPIVERDRIEDVETMLQGSMETKIHLNLDAIAKWKNQFGTD